MSKPRKFEIKYREYDRHEDLGVVVFRRTGSDVLEAVGKLPTKVLDDVFCDDWGTNVGPKTVKDLLVYLNNIDLGGFSYLTIKEFRDGQVFTWVDFGDDDLEDEDQDWE